MTPGPLRPETVQRRLVEISQLLGVLRRHTATTPGRLRGDLEHRLMVERALQQLVDLAVKINVHVATSAGLAAPGDYHTSFAAAAQAGMLPDDLAASLAPSAGLRNRLVHEYEELDYDAVAEAVPTAVEQYGRYLEVAATWLQQRGRPGNV